MEKNKLLTVYTTNNANEAEVIAAAIHAEGMKCEIEGESQAGLAGINTMEINLVVRADDYDRVKAFIDQHLRD